MRLLNTSTYALNVFDDVSCTPPYAILSHTWGVLDEEITFTDFCHAKKTFQEPSGQKLRGACHVAQRHGLGWIWVDAVCIDRSSSAELTEAVNSAHRWLQQCQICLVYLKDFQSTEREQDSLKEELARCRWFTRSWTLQELIIPSNVQFFNGKWNYIGSKISLMEPLVDITRIDAAVLRDPGCLTDFSIGRRMAWAAKRSARYVEDIAYSLVGLFAVTLQVLYGDGKRAFLKLQEEILRDTNDFSVLAWEPRTNNIIRGLLAHDPSEFSHFSSRCSTGALQMQGDIMATSAGFCIQDFFKSDNSGQEIILRLYDEQNSDDSSKSLGVKFKKWNNYYVRISRLVLNPSIQPAAWAGKVRVLRDIDQKQSDIIYDYLLKEKHQNVLLNEPVPSISHEKAYCVQPSSLASKQFPGAKFSKKGSVSISQYAHSMDVESSSALGTAPTRSSTMFRSHDTATSTEATNAETVAYSLYASPVRMDSTPTVEVEDDVVSSIHSDASPDYNESEEDDMNIINMPSPKPTELDPAFADVQDELIEYALHKFSQYDSRAECSSKRAKERGYSSTSKRRKSNTLNMHIEVGNVSNSDEENEETVLVGFRKPKRDYFACPYYQHDSAKYQSCLNREGLITIKDIKRHLWAEHRQPYFCLVCYRIFPTALECNNHTRSRSCVLRDKQEIDGISGDQMQQLTAKSNPEQSPEQQWFAIWDIVFPDKERPKQPYFSGNIETLVCLLQEYWTKQGKGVIAEFLESKNMRDYGTMANEERNLEALYVTVLRQIVCKVLTCSRENSSSFSLARFGTSRHWDWDFANILRRIISGNNQ